MKEKKLHSWGQFEPGGYRARCGRLVSSATASWLNVTCGACLRSRRFISDGGGYITPEIMTRRQFAAEAQAALRDVDYDTLVGTGLSGALAVPLLARALRKRWMIIRKPREFSHAGAASEGQLGRRWVLVDDFVSTGATRRRVLAAVQLLSQSADWKTTFVGTYTYKRDGYQAATPDQIREGSTT